MSRVYGYAVVDKDGNPAPVMRNVYDTKNAAANGFHQWTKYLTPHYSRDGHLAGKKLSEQDEYRVVGLVAE